MGTNMKTYRKLQKIFAAFLILSLSISFIQPSAVSAASIYDSHLQLTSSVELYRNDIGLMNDCSNVDVTSDWASPLANYSGFNAQQQAARDSFNTARTGNGRWGVSYQDTSYPYDQKYYFIFWTEDDSLALQFDNSVFFDSVLAFATEPDGVTPKTGLKYVRVDGAGGLYGSPCTPEISSVDISGSSAIVVSTNTGERKNFFTYTNHPNYPSSYEGERLGYEIQGNVICADPGANLSAVRITAQEEPDRNVVLSDGGSGSKNYNHSLLREEPYSLVAICNGEAYYGPTISDNFSYNYHWICTKTTPGQNPNLNVCAAS